MGHIPDDKNFDEFMNADAEEWSKPDTKPDKPGLEEERVDRWGSPTEEKPPQSEQERWGGEPPAPGQPGVDPQAKKSGTRWWIIVLVVLLVLCLCLCVLGFALPNLGMNLLPANFPF